MTLTLKTTAAPKDCPDMASLRVQIDAIDRHLVEVLALRAAHIDRAAELKKIENLPARTTDRVAQVIGKVRASAEEAGLDPDLAETLWAALIEWSIQREMRDEVPEEL